MVDTLLLAVSQRDRDRLDELVETAAGVVGADGTVEVLHVFDSDRYGKLKERLGVDPFSETTPDDIARRNSVAADAVERLDGRGVDVAIRGAVGDAAEEILDVASGQDTDMVVVGGRGRSQTGKLLFGSTAQQVLLEADCPVTFVKARDDDAPRRTAPAEA